MRSRSLSWQTGGAGSAETTSASGACARMTCALIVHSSRGAQIHCVRIVPGTGHRERAAMMTLAISLALGDGSQSSPRFLQPQLLFLVFVGVLFLLCFSPFCFPFWFLFLSLVCFVFCFCFCFCLFLFCFCFLVFRVFCDHYLRVRRRILLGYRGASAMLFVRESF